MKKLISVLVILVALSCLLVSCFDSEDPSEGDSGKLGNYNIVIDSFRIAANYEGKPIVIVKYVFTNNDEEATSFMASIIDNVYQNGIELEHCYTAADSANFSSDNQTKNLKQGASLEIEAAYYLNDTTTDIEVEISEAFSFNDKTISKTFSIK